MSAERWSKDERGSVRERTMRGRRSIGPASWTMVGVVFILIGVLAGAIAGHLAAPATASTVTGTQHLYLTVAFNPYTNLDEFLPANFTVTVGVPVIITITNYDNGTNPVNPYYASVLGTVDGTENVTNATLANAVVRSIPANQVGHTFSVYQGLSDASLPIINVPISPAQGQTPTTVTFTVVFTSEMQYLWKCNAPCDGQAMASLGFMRGTITVSSA